MESLVRRRLSAKTWSPTSTLVLKEPNEISGRAAATLEREFNAVGWILVREADAESDRPQHEIDHDTSPVTCEPIVASPMSGCAPRLMHWTRRRSGPWPGDSEEEFLDDLILDSPDAGHAPIAALLRIVRQRVLLASEAAIRGSYRVVCFSELTPRELVERRVFRSHRGRYDFEPYGICLQERILVEKGARPVIYGDESVWSDLADGDRPFFQKRRSEESAIDWTIEREWRCLGDLSLADFGPDDAVVFVPTVEEAKTVACESPWPVTIAGKRAQG